MSPHFSIVTPCFNAAKVLPRCVGSIRGQQGVSIEHIIQDGLSKDVTVSWAQSQANLAVFSEKDRGMYDAINKGWAKSHGEILSWLNADEQYLPGSLSRVAQVFQDNPDVDIVYGNTIIVGPSGQPLAARREIPLRLSYILNGFLYALSCSLFFRRRLLDAGLLVFEPGFRNAGDLDLIVRLIKAGCKSIQMHDYIGLFGIYGNNITIDGNTKMDKEVDEIRRKYGALPSPMRQTVMLGRAVERLFRGCYRPDRLSYEFALDEKPNYTSIKNVKTSSRFTFRRALRQIQQSSQPC